MRREMSQKFEKLKSQTDVIMYIKITKLKGH